MTPTERAAVAAAIAALESFAKDAEPYSFKEDGAQSSYCFRVGQLRQAKRALASLRALAPAPADQSDAGHGISSEELRRIDPINPGFIDALEEVNRRESDAGRDEGIEAEWQSLLDKDDRTSPAEYPDMCLISRDELSDIIDRALASATSETVGEK